MSNKLKQPSTRTGQNGLYQLAGSQIPYRSHHQITLNARHPRGSPRRHLAIFSALLLTILFALSASSRLAHGQQRQTTQQAAFKLDNPLAAGGWSSEGQSSRVGKLGPPIALQQVEYYHGPGIDLVALNQRRFETEHQHQGGSSQLDLERGELIEHKVASIPERVMENLPEDVNKQLLSTLAADATFLTGDAGAGNLAQISLEVDPDGASIERLTKSCLSVHASSARPEMLNVTFFLYTRRNPHHPYVVSPSVSRQELIRGSPLDPQRPIKWITHGFHTNVDKSEWMVETKDKILANEDANVFLTDWRRGASPALAFYPKAAANAHVVAKMIVKILRRLRGDIDLKRVHLIGHSLGAHIMGFVGSAFTEEYLYQQQHLLMVKDTLNPDRPFWRHLSERPDVGPDRPLIGRITACDPALPCFGPSSSAVGSTPGHSAREAATAAALASTSAATIAANPAVASAAAVSSPDDDWTPSMWTHLRPDSAILVEVIHSNPGVMGYSEPLGDYDFYPNGLDRQPGCGSSQAESGMAKQTKQQDQYVARTPETRGRRQLGTLNSWLGSWWGGQQSRREARAGEPSRLSSTIDRFIKPIKDFFMGYTCSHHRSVEYMVESMYYDHVPQDRKLDRDFVCQMVGYRCSDYLSFKRGFCFRCLTDLDCRAFTMTGGGQGSLSLPRAQEKLTRARSLSPEPERPSKFDLRLAGPTLNASGEPTDGGGGGRWSKRVLPTSNHYGQGYLPAARNKYYFDTRAASHFCAQHYHLFVKYRWFRVRESVALDGLELRGTLANVTRLAKNLAPFHRFTYQTYTMLLTERTFLGQIDSLAVYGDGLKATLVDYIEVTYMSNLDPRVRALGSARLCRLPGPSSSVSLPMGPTESRLVPSHLFVRCSGGSFV